jgi:cytochrome P450
VLSRYAEVLAAFRESRLWPIGSAGENQMEVRDQTGTLLVRGDIQDSVSPVHVAQWQAHMESLAAGILDRLAEGRPVDLLRGFSQPWCLALAILATGASPGDSQRLADLGADVFAGTGEPDRSDLQMRAAAATSELERYFQKGVVRMGEPTFVGISQTMARLLANIWLALLRHPGAVARLRQEPDLMPRAVEELLRYAGIVPTLFRRAVGDVEIGGVRIGEGQRVNLMIASANRDTEQFPDPDRLDITRRPAGHFALGTGRNSCVGATLIRVAAGVSIGGLLNRFSRVELSGPAEWHTGHGFSWPASVNVILQR